jgi:ABC-2 type transport system permease protein
MAETQRERRSGSRWRAFRTAAWLGWQIEANWADGWLFAAYIVLRPLALAGILVVMYATVAGGTFGSPVFTFMYLGNAFYVYVGAVMSGMGWAVIQDREHYRTLKSMYTAPIDVRVYLAGRGVAKFVTASVSVFVTLAVGVIAFDLPITTTTVNWPMLGAALGLGLVSLALMGLVMAGIMLLAGNESWGLSELLAGALYLFSGAIFPLDVLPAALRPIALALPVTYWLELMRRALVGAAARAFPTFGSWSDQELLGALLALTAALAVGSVALFHLCERTARRRGLIDRTSNY